MMNVHELIGLVSGIITICTCLYKASQKIYKLIIKKIARDLIIAKKELENSDRK